MSPELDTFIVHMRIACDRTKSRKDGVLVRTEDWHALMDLAEKAKRKYMASEAT